MTTAGDLMTEKPVTIPVTSTAGQAMRLLESLDIRHLPVLDAGELVGMISDRDLRGVATEERIAELMAADVISVDTEADVAEVVDLMVEFKIGAVPVVDGDGFLAGIVSYIDVLRALGGAAAAE
jgi:acetoin utilization protein AcuB